MDGTWTVAMICVPEGLTRRLLTLMFKSSTPVISPAAHHTASLGAGKVKFDFSNTQWPVEVALTSQPQLLESH